MVGATAIIGLSAGGVASYYLGDREEASVTLLPQQTLSGTAVELTEAGLAVEFSAPLDDAGIPASLDPVPLLYARGDAKEEPGYHFPGPARRGGVTASLVTRAAAPVPPMLPPAPPPTTPPPPPAAAARLVGTRSVRRRAAGAAAAAPATDAAACAAAAVESRRGRQLHRDGVAPLASYLCNLRLSAEMVLSTS